MSQTNLFQANVSQGGDDPTRTARQVEIVDKWQANRGKGTLEAVTGFGKTRTALMAAERLINSPNAKTQRDLTVIVPSIELKKDWEEKLKYYDFPSRVFVVNTYINIYSLESPRETSLLVLDEFHRYHSPEHGRVFEATNYNFIFGTTATIDDTDPKFIRMKKLCPIIDTVSLEEATANNWVSDYTIFNLGIDMSPEEKEYYGRLGRQYNKYFKTFDFEFGTAMDCLSNKDARRDYARQIGWDEGAIMTHAVQFSRIVQKRKHFLYELPSKLTAAKEIINRFSDHIFISFSESTDFADRLAEELPDIAVPYHSSLATLIKVKGTDEVVAKSTKVNGKTKYKDLDTGIIHSWANIKKVYPKKKLKRLGKTRRRDQSIRLFKEEDNGIRLISTARALDEGFNVPRINASIVTSGSSKTRQSIQRLGRMIRQEEGKRAFQVEIYIRNTQDEVWLRSRQKESINVNWIDRIDEINI